jgi:hypothetical protein
MAGNILSMISPHTKKIYIRRANNSKQHILCKIWKGLNIQVTLNYVIPLSIMVFILHVRAGYSQMA